MKSANYMHMSWLSFSCSDYKRKHTFVTECSTVNSSLFCRYYLIFFIVFSASSHLLPRQNILRLPLPKQAERHWSRTHLLPLQIKENLKEEIRLAMKVKTIERTCFRLKVKRIRIINSNNTKANGSKSITQRQTFKFYICSFL